jgi:hypothetical protein
MFCPSSLQNCAKLSVVKSLCEAFFMGKAFKVAYSRLEFIKQSGDSCLTFGQLVIMLKIVSMEHGSITFTVCCVECWCDGSLF